jgi:small-conductance mechanosensitive channel
MAKEYKVGDRVRYEKAEGTVSDVVDDLKCVRVKFDDGRVMRIPWDDVHSIAAAKPAHKQVEGPK